MIQSSQMTWQVFFHLKCSRQTAKALSLFSSQLSVSSMECARYWDLGSFVVDNVITGLCACSIVNKLLTWFHKWWISCQIIAFRGLKKYFAFENSWIEWQISSLSRSKKAYGFFCVCIFWIWLSTIGIWYCLQNIQDWNQALFS